ncbi:MAG: hypothetical protein IT569_06285 [Leptospiraceae bacterium]|nr:hypothetical protein [Leptospiraceae bacterium]
MGRTVEPYSRQSLRVEERLSDFKRALRKSDQETFDELIRAAKLNLQAGVMASNPNPLDSMLVSMILSLSKEVKSLQKELRSTKERLDKNERPSF